MKITSMLSWDSGGFRKKRENLRHSSAFHRYFEGYAEHRVPQEDGTFQIERFYVGEYYRQDLSDRGRLGIRLLYVLLFFLSVRIFVLAGVQNTGSNLFLGTIACQIGCVCAYIGLFFILIAYLTSKREMEVRTYRETSQSLRKCTRVLCCFQCGAAAMTLVYLVLSRGENLATELECAALYGISATAIFWMGKTERQIRYVTIPNSRKADPEDVIIDY